MLNHTSPDADVSARREPAYSLPFVLLIVTVYVLAHTATRLLSSANLGEDDPLDTLLTQSLAAGYSGYQGPLYDWLIWLLQQPLGIGLHTFLTLKYGLLIAIAGFMFVISLRLTGSRLWAFIAVESMATVYQIFWRLHEGFTHRVGAMAAVIATVWILIRVIDHGRQRDYWLLGVVLGLGLLTEHVYLSALICLTSAACLQPAIRRQIFRPALLQSLILAGLIIAPYGLWLLADTARAAQLADALFPPLPDYSKAPFAKGLQDALTFPVLVLAPYIVIVLSTFPGIFRAMPPNMAPAANPAQPDLDQLLKQTLAIALTGIVAYNGLLYARTSYGVHSILPLMIIAIPWLTRQAQLTRPSPKRIKVFMAILLAFTITAYAVRSGNLFIYEPFCNRCRWAIPYAELTESIQAQGFQRGVIVTSDVHLGGNLRRFFPDSRIVLAPSAEASSHLRGATRQAVLLIWPEQNDRIDMPTVLASELPAGTSMAIMELKHPWRGPFKQTGYRHSVWGATIMPPAVD